MVDMEFRWLMVVCKIMGLFLDLAMDMDMPRHPVLPECVRRTDIIFGIARPMAMAPQINTASSVVPHTCFAYRSFEGINFSIGTTIVVVISFVNLQCICSNFRVGTWRTTFNMRSTLQWCRFITCLQFSRNFFKKHFQRNISRNLLTNSCLKKNQH